MQQERYKAYTAFLTNCWLGIQCGMLGGYNVLMDNGTTHDIALSVLRNPFNHVVFNHVFKIP
jgi:hypothetical protein